MKGIRMNIDDILPVNSFSYILGAVSIIGFIIVARNEVRIWFHHLAARLRASRAAQSEILPVDLNSPNAIRPANQLSIILGLIFLGITISVAIFLIHLKGEQIERSISLNTYLMIIFVFTMLPGGLAGLLAGVWINAKRQRQQGRLLAWLVYGMLFYLAFITAFEFTEIHLLLFVSGPAVTLLAYRFS